MNKNIFPIVLFLFGTLLMSVGCVDTRREKSKQIDSELASRIKVEKESLEKLAPLLEEAKDNSQESIELVNELSKDQKEADSIFEKIKDLNFYDEGFEITPDESELLYNFVALRKKIEDRVKTENVNELLSEINKQYAESQVEERKSPDSLKLRDSVESFRANEMLVRENIGKINDIEQKLKEQEAQIFAKVNDAAKNFGQHLGNRIQDLDKALSTLATATSLAKIKEILNKTPNFFNLGAEVKADPVNGPEFFNLLDSVLPKTLESIIEKAKEQKKIIDESLIVKPDMTQLEVNKVARQLDYSLGNTNDELENYTKTLGTTLAKNIRSEKLENFLNAEINPVMVTAPSAAPTPAPKPSAPTISGGPPPPPGPMTKKTAGDSVAPPPASSSGGPPPPPGPFTPKSKSPTGADDAPTMPSLETQDISSDGFLKISNREYELSVSDRPMILGGEGEIDKGGQLQVIAGDLKQDTDNAPTVLSEEVTLGNDDEPAKAGVDTPAGPPSGTDLKKGTPPPPPPPGGPGGAKIPPPPPQTPGTGPGAKKPALSSPGGAKKAPVKKVTVQVPTAPIVAVRKFLETVQKTTENIQKVAGTTNKVKEDILDALAALNSFQFLDDRISSTISAAIEKITNPETYSPSYQSLTNALEPYTLEALTSALKQNGVLDSNNEDILSANFETYVYPMLSEKVIKAVKDKVKSIRLERLKVLVAELEKNENYKKMKQQMDLAYNMNQDLFKVYKKMEGIPGTTAAVALFKDKCAEINNKLQGIQKESFNCDKLAVDLSTNALALFEGKKNVQAAFVGLVQQMAGEFNDIIDRFKNFGLATSKEVQNPLNKELKIKVDNDETDFSDALSILNQFLSDKAKIIIDTNEKKYTVATIISDVKKLMTEEKIIDSVGDSKFSYAESIENYARELVPDMDEDEIRHLEERVFVREPIKIVLERPAPIGVLKLTNVQKIEKEKKDAEFKEKQKIQDDIYAKELKEANNKRALLPKTYVVASFMGAVSNAGYDSIIQPFAGLPSKEILIPRLIDIASGSLVDASLKPSGIADFMAAYEATKNAPDDAASAEAINRFAQFFNNTKPSPGASYRQQVLDLALIGGKSGTINSEMEDIKDKVENNKGYLALKQISEFSLSAIDNIIIDTGKVAEPGGAPISLADKARALPKHLRDIIFDTDGGAKIPVVEEFSKLVDGLKKALELLKLGTLPGVSLAKNESVLRPMVNAFSFIFYFLINKIGQALDDKDDAKLSEYFMPFVAPGYASSYVVKFKKFRSVVGDKALGAKGDRAIIKALIDLRKKLDTATSSVTIDTDELIINRLKYDLDNFLK